MEQNIEKITNERGQEYGDFNIQANTAQKLKETLRKSPNWGRMDAAKKEGLDMICHKMARILCGNPENVDSWVDIEGYARIVRIRLGDQSRID